MGRTLIAAACCLASFSARADTWSVDPDRGNSTLSAVFDAKLGERISATSSSVECILDYDDKKGTASGTCKVPLTGIIVDNEGTKTEHFQQWATNKKMDPKECFFEARLDSVKVGRLEPEKPAEFSAQIPFTLCGKAREDGVPERVTGTALLFPPGSYGDTKAIRIRAKVEHFNREKYRIGPGFTEGWLARVQSLAKVVAAEGTLELSLFAKPKK